MNMMENLKTKKIIALIGMSLIMVSCKAPMATVIKDEVKENLPPSFNSRKNGRMLIIIVE